MLEPPPKYHIGDIRRGVYWGGGSESSLRVVQTDGRVIDRAPICPDLARMHCSAGCLGRPSDICLQVAWALEHLRLFLPSLFLRIGVPMAALRELGQEYLHWWVILVEGDDIAETESMPCNLSWTWRRAKRGKLWEFDI